MAIVTSLTQHLPPANTKNMFSAAATCWGGRLMRCGCARAVYAQRTLSTTARVLADGARKTQAASAPLSFSKRLFAGEVQTEKLFPFPNALDAEQHDTLKMLVEPVEKFFAERVDSKRIDKEAQIPKETMDGLKELGLFGLQIPQEYGGLGLSNTAYARVVEVISQDGSLAVTLMAHQSIGLKGILMFGNEAQKQKYLPRLASGEHVAAFALTEPSSGSDAGSIRTRATLSADGRHFLLNGSKIWISNGGIAEIFTVFARTIVVDPVTGDKKDKVTAFIVERAFGGLTNGKPEDKMGIKGSNTTEVYFENCPVPIENVLGDVGGGFKIAVNILNSGRYGLGAGAGGGSKNLLRLATEHASTRQQFGRPLKDFGLIQDKIAQMALSAYAIESMAYLTTGLIDNGEKDASVEAAMCKVYGSEAIWTNGNEALQILGGMGYMREYPFERIVRDSRILLIFEGTNEILRLFIALSGIQAPGERLKKLGAAAKAPWSNPGLLLKEAIARAQAIAKVDRPALPDAHTAVAKPAALLADATCRFRDAVDKALRVHGKGIIDQQLILRRMADVSIDLYAIAATVARSTRSLNQKSPTAEHEALLCNTLAAQTAPRINANIAGIVAPSTDDAVKKIAADIFGKGGYIPPHPLEI